MCCVMLYKLLRCVCLCLLVCAVVFHVCDLFVMYSAMPCVLCLFILGCVVCDVCWCNVLYVFACGACNVLCDDVMCGLLLVVVMCVRECVLFNVRVCVVCDLMYIVVGCVALCVWCLFVCACAFNACVACDA